MNQIPWTLKVSMLKWYSAMINEARDDYLTAVWSYKKMAGTGSELFTEQLPALGYWDSHNSEAWEINIFKSFRFMVISYNSPKRWGHHQCITVHIIRL